MNPFGTVAVTLAIYIFFGLYALFLYVKRREDHEYGVFALLCLALVAHGVGRFFAFRAESVGNVEAACRLELFGLSTAFALTLHLALVFSQSGGFRRWLVILYAAAGGFEILNARGLLHSSALRLLPSQSTDWNLANAPSEIGIVRFFACAAATAVALFLFARAYVRGKREALGIVIGATILLATTINDAIAAVAFVAVPELLEFGFVAFSLGVSTTVGVRYSTQAGELERKTVELRAKTRELRVSYDELQIAHEELVRKEQLAVVGELAAVIAHEVRNPLAVISNAVAGLRKSSIRPDDRETLLSILEEETLRLNRLVTDLLRYARPVNLQYALIMVHDILEKSATILRKDHPAVAVNFDFTTSEPIWGDSNSLRQVFDNLIANALQAMGGFGTLTLRVRAWSDADSEKEIGPAPTEEHVRLEQNCGVAIDVIDTGEGMDTSVRARARDPFFTTRPSGTGLGLAIVDRIVEAHGGRLVIESGPGSGTHVSVVLPRGSAQGPKKERWRAES